MVRNGLFVIWKIFIKMIMTLDDPCDVFAGKPRVVHIAKVGIVVFDYAGLNATYLHARSTARAELYAKNGWLIEKNDETVDSAT